MVANVQPVIQPERGPDLTVPIFDAPYVITPKMNVAGGNPYFNILSQQPYVLAGCSALPDGCGSNYGMLNFSQASTAMPFTVVQLFTTSCAGQIIDLDILQYYLEGLTVRALTEDGYIAATNPYQMLEGPPGNNTGALDGYYWPYVFFWAQYIAPNPPVDPIVNVTTLNGPTPQGNTGPNTGYPYFQGTIEENDVIREPSATYSMWRMFDGPFPFMCNVFWSYNPLLEQYNDPQILSLAFPLGITYGPRRLCSFATFGHTAADPDGTVSDAERFLTCWSSPDGIDNYIWSFCSMGDGNPAHDYYKIYKSTSTGVGAGFWDCDLFATFPRTAIAVQDPMDPESASTLQIYLHATMFSDGLLFPDPTGTAGRMVYILADGSQWGIITLVGETANAATAIASINGNGFDPSIVMGDPDRRFWIVNNLPLQNATYVGYSNVLDLSFSPLTLGNFQGINLSCANCPPLFT